MQAQTTPMPEAVKAAMVPFSAIAENRWFWMNGYLCWRKADPLVSVWRVQYPDGEPPEEFQSDRELPLNLAPETLVLRIDETDTSGGFRQLGEESYKWIVNHPAGELPVSEGKS